MKETVETVWQQRQNIIHLTLQSQKLLLPPQNWNEPIYTINLGLTTRGLTYFVP